jgi:hypothetical protein
MCSNRRKGRRQHQEHLVKNDTPRRTEIDERYAQVGFRAVPWGKSESAERLRTM